MHFTSFHFQNLCSVPVHPSTTGQTELAAEGPILGPERIIICLGLNLLRRLRSGRREGLDRRQLRRRRAFRPLELLVARAVLRRVARL